MLDCYLFNAPFLEQVSVVAAFKDPRQLDPYKCCNMDELNGPDVNPSFIDQLVKDKLVDCNYGGPVTLELCYRNDYLKEDVKSFYKEGYTRGEKVKALFQKD